MPTYGGVYAAWIVDGDAVGALGAGGPAPVLMYVGKASSAPGGLQRRLKRHATTAWWELSDLLAARGIVTAGWWAYGAHNHAGRMPPMPPLAKRTFDATLDWQQREFRWGWAAVDDDVLGGVESRLIAEHAPLLNWTGRGMQPPPQLRAIGGYEASRAKWLFHVSWLMVLLEQPAGWAERRLGRLNVAWDAEGWPTPIGNGQQHRFRIPNERAAQRFLEGTMGAGDRSVLKNPTPSHQARAWWAAYAGHPLLRTPEDHNEAVRRALRSETSGPDRLPNALAQKQLLEMIGRRRRLPPLGH